MNATRQLRIESVNVVFLYALSVYNRGEREKERAQHKKNLLAEYKFVFYAGFISLDFRLLPIKCAHILQ